MRTNKAKNLERMSAAGLFFIFLITNIIISYSSLSFSVKAWFFFFGLLIPFSIGLWRVRMEPREEFPRFKEFLPPFSKTVLFFIAVAAVYLRLFKLTTVPLWFTGDEALQGLFGIELLRSWDWKFFYTVGQHPPLAVWFFSFGIRFLKSSLLVLKWLPAFFSVLTVGVGYWAARKYFSRSFSVLVLCLLGFSFWPIFAGKPYLQFVPFWELMAFGLLAIFLKEKNPLGQKRAASVLGLWTGLGCLTYTSWHFVILAISVTVLFYVGKDTAKRLSLLGYFFLCLAMGLAPFLAAVGREGFGSHILEIIGSSNVGFPDRRWMVFFSYFTSLFWGSFDPGESYGPVWGGLLNPILSSFFFLGIIEMFRWRRSPFIQWLALCFFIFMMPGFLAADYTVMFRVIQVMVIVLLIAALGFQKILSEVKETRRPWVMFLLVFCFAAPDFYHLLKPSLEERKGGGISFKTEIPDESFRAFKILEDCRNRMGPGLIFTDFLLLSHSHTLYVATFPFNASCDPALDPQAAKWAAVVVNIHYAPFLAQRFEGFKAYALGQDISDDGGLMAGLIPLTPKNKKAMEGWVEAQRYFHGLNIEAEDILQSPRKYQKAVEALPAHCPFPVKDPFLSACFYEWMAQYHYALNSYEKNTELIESAIREGYPAAHLYFKEGNFLLLNHHRDQAKKAYESALRCRDNRTKAAEALASLKE